jgi:hypothetical protein
MGPRPTQGNEKRLLLPSAQQLLSMEAPRSPLSSRPKRTRISCHAALDKAACAALRKESRMKFVNAINLNRKSGVAQWRDLLFRTWPELSFCEGRRLKANFII